MNQINNQNPKKHTINLQTSLRTHTCNELNVDLIGNKVKLIGWIGSVRNHGGVIFADLRDKYGITQITIDSRNKDKQKLELINQLDRTSTESIVSVFGFVQKREEGTDRKDIKTGEIEVAVDSIETISESNPILPFQIDDNLNEANEALRLKYRFLDLRRTKMQEIISKRSEILFFVQQEMHQEKFTQVQTPILSAPTPEGATDYIIPSRLHSQYHFYALPQSPQQYKQLLMIGGFDRYFQIAPCFRNEDPRSNRAIGDFYQIDIEMCFVQKFEDIAKCIEKLILKLFAKFSKKKICCDRSQGLNNKSDSDSLKIQQITHKDAMTMYGSDKPDLRNPIINSDVTNVFADSGFSIFANAIKKGAVIRAIPAPSSSEKPRSFFDNKIKLAQKHNAQGLAYIVYDKDGTAKGPIAKLLTSEEISQIKKITKIKNGDSVFFSCGDKKFAEHIAGIVRSELGTELNLLKDEYHFCWIIDFPMFEEIEDENHPNAKRLDFSHNPFSKSKKPISTIIDNSNIGNNENPKINTQKALELVSNQFDLVCNGNEIGSGGIRNIDKNEMYDAFRIAGFNMDYVNTKFPGIIKALTLGGIPPHGGMALGFDRLLMLLMEIENIRDVIAFPLGSNGSDLLMHTPAILSDKEFKKSIGKPKLADRLIKQVKNEEYNLASSTINEIRLLKELCNLKDILNLKHESGDTILHIACKNHPSKDLTQFIKLLINNETCVNVKNDFRRTPLHTIITNSPEQEIINIIKIIIDKCKKETILAKDLNGLTALEYANSESKTQIESIINSHLVALSKTDIA